MTASIAYSHAILTNNMTQTIQVTLTKSPVELYKVLKFEGIAASGGEAKLLVDQGLVSVNGETETRKRRKIIAGDSIQIEDLTIEITE